MVDGCGSSRILDGVNSPLSSVPIDKRRQLAATLGLFAVLFVAVGTVSATGHQTAVLRVFTVIAFLVAVLLSLTGWGVIHTIKIDLAEQRLDAAIEAAIAGRHGDAALACGCGHDHDPDELHVDEGGATGAGACAHGIATEDCTGGDCTACVLSRPARRPMPGPGN